MMSEQMDEQNWTDERKAIPKEPTEVAGSRQRKGADQSGSMRDYNSGNIRSSSAHKKVRKARLRSKKSASFSQRNTLATFPFIPASNSQMILEIVVL